MREIQSTFHLAGPRSTFATRFRTASLRLRLQPLDLHQPHLCHPPVQPRASTRRSPPMPPIHLIALRGSRDAGFGETSRLPEQDEDPDDQARRIEDGAEARRVSGGVSGGEQGGRRRRPICPEGDAAQTVSRQGRGRPRQEGKGLRGRDLPRLEEENPLRPSRSHKTSQRVRG